jgi:hypothetical protein
MHQQQQQHYGGATAGGMDHSRSNVLLVFIDDVEYTPTLDALHTVFKTYGHVHKMTVFEKSGNWQVRGTRGGVGGCDTLLLWWWRAQTGMQAASVQEGGSASAAVLGATAAVAASVLHNTCCRGLQVFLSVYVCLRCVCFICMQALVQYADEGTAEQAKEYLDGHCMYPNHRNKVRGLERHHGCVHCRHLAGACAV